MDPPVAQDDREECGSERSRHIAGVLTLSARGEVRDRRNERQPGGLS